jgi:hypothetical protein
MFCPNNDKNMNLSKIPAIALFVAMIFISGCGTVDYLKEQPLIRSLARTGLTLGLSKVVGKALERNPGAVEPVSKLAWVIRQTTDPHPTALGESLSDYLAEIGNEPLRAELVVIVDHIDSWWTAFVREQNAKPDGLLVEDLRRLSGALMRAVAETNNPPPTPVDVVLDQVRGGGPPIANFGNGWVIK